MADYGAKISKAKQAGYSDAEIAAFLSKDPALAPKIQTARKSGYDDAAILGHLGARKPAEGLIGRAWEATTDAGGKLRAELGRQVSSGRGDVAPLVGGALSALGAGPASIVNDLVVKPTANILAAIPAQAYGPTTLKGPGKPLDRAETVEMWEGAIGGALSAVGPGPKGLKVPRPVKVNPLAEPVAQFERAGVRPTYAAVKGGPASSVANAIAENPVAGIRARAALDGSINDARVSAGRVASTYGNAQERGAQGEAVQSGIRDFNTRFSERAEKLYDRAFLPIETSEGQAVAKASGQTEAARAAAKADFEARTAKAEADYAAGVQAAEQAAQEQNAIRVGQPRVEPVMPARAQVSPMADILPQRPAVVPSQSTQALREITGRVNAPQLSNMITDGRMRSIAEALSNDGAEVRFTDLRALRTWVRNAQKDPTLRQGISQGDLNRLEGSLTTDIYNNAERLAGPQGKKNLERADQFYRLGSQRINGALQSFVGKGGAVSGESAYDLIVRAASDKGGADAARLAALRKSLSDSDWGDIAATTVQRLGRPTASNATGVDDFSVNSFVTNYQTMSPRGRDLIFGTGEQRKELDNLVSVVERLKRVEKGANASKTGVSLQALGTVGGLANPATTVPTLTVLSGLGVTGEMLTNPSVVRWLSRIGNAKTPSAMTRAVEQLKLAAAKNKALEPLAYSLGQSVVEQSRQELRQPR